MGQGFYENARFVTGTICMPVICIVGISGNLMSLIVLTRPYMRTSTNVYLSALALGDTVKLINDGVYFVHVAMLQYDSRTASQMVAHSYPVCHYVNVMSVCMTSWITVCLAFERHIAVRHPLRAHVWCTVRRATLVSIAITAIMALVPLPTLFRYKTVHQHGENETTAVLDVSDFWKNETNRTVLSWIIGLVRAIIPLCILFSLNLCIIRSLMNQEFNGPTLTARQRVTFMLVTVVMIYVVCFTPDVIMSTVLGLGYYDENKLVKGIREITDILVSLNSATNFFVYCLWSVKFRTALASMLCRSHRGHHVTGHNNRGATDSVGSDCIGRVSIQTRV